jgi:hypothetical protein
VAVQLVFRTEPRTMSLFDSEEDALAQAAADVESGHRDPLEIRDESGDNVVVSNAQLRKAAK